MKCSSSYRPEFQREGVLRAIDSLASRKLIHSKSKSETSTTETTTEAAPLKRSSVPADPQDVVTIRARVIRLKYLSGHMEGEDDHVASRLRTLAETLALRTNEADVLKSSVEEASQLLSGSMRDISSFEIRQSGMVETLLVFVSRSDYEGKDYPSLLSQIIKLTLVISFTATTAADVCGSFHRSGAGNSCKTIAGNADSDGEL
jgi:E3 ubiquitin-protein ligase TRIP12